MMGKLKAGDPAPDFQLPDQSGGLVRLADFRGRKLLVYFYPRADTPGCTRQSCAVRDALPDLRAAGIDAVGISPDGATAQNKFDRKFSLGFPLLADVDHAVAAAWGAWDTKSLYGKIVTGIIRSAFLVDEEGRIAGAWYKVKPEDTVAKARALLG